MAFNSDGNSQELEDLLAQLPKISEQRNYWFVRTQGGLYYRDFVERGFIAIGYNEITLKDVNEAISTKFPVNTLAMKIREKYGKEEKRPRYVASQLIKFVRDIKKDDIVLIPSDNSTSISFGRVANSSTYVEKPKSNDEKETQFLKRKKVKWQKKIFRDKLDPNLYKLMFTHHAVNEGNHYGPYIDKIINDFFVKGDTAHVVLEVQTTADIKAKDLFEFGIFTIDLLEDFCKQEEIQYSPEDLNVKLELESPGVIEFSGIVPILILAGCILIFIAGGVFSFHHDKGVVDAGFKSDGVIEKLRRYLTSNTNNKIKRELLKKHMDKLEIKKPEDLAKVFGILDSVSKDENQLDEGKGKDDAK